MRRPRPGDLRLGRGMTTPYVDTHIKRLAIAREAAELAHAKRLRSTFMSTVSRCRALVQPRARQGSSGGAAQQRDLGLGSAAAVSGRGRDLLHLFERLRMAGHGSSVSMVVAYREFAATINRRFMSASAQNGHNPRTR